MLAQLEMPLDSRLPSAGFSIDNAGPSFAREDDLQLMNARTSNKPERSKRAAVAPMPATIVRPVDNAIRILRYLSLIQNPTTLTSIARELKINASTCFNILRTLVWNGVLEFDSTTKGYRTGPGAVDLANRALLRTTNAVERMRPHLERFVQTYELTVSVWRRIGEDRKMLVLLVDRPTGFRLHARIGQRLPLLAGASGRVMAACGGLEETEIRSQFPTVRWGRPLSISEFLEDVRKVHKTGWAIDDDLYLPGATSVAAPIYNLQGTLRATLSATMLRGQHDRKTVKEIALEVKKLADAFTTNHPID